MTVNGIDTITGGQGNDIITGGGAADILTLTAGGADVIDITGANQGGATVTGNSGATIATGDVITGFASTDDSVDLDGPISNTVAATEGGAGDANFEAVDGLGVITTNFDFSGTQTAAGVLGAITAAFGDVVISDTATVFFSIADNTVVAGDGSNLFQVTNNSGAAITDDGNNQLSVAGVTVSHVASFNDELVAGDFTLS